MREIPSMVGARSVGDRLERIRPALDYLTRGTAPPARIAPMAREDRGGYGFELLKLDGAELAGRRPGGRDRERRAAGRTGGERARSGTSVTARTPGSVYLTMPLNLRPPEWRYEVVGDYASYVSVHLAGDDLTDLDTATSAAAERTRRIKEDGMAGLLIDLFEAPTALPTGIKKRLQALIPLTGNLAVNTAALSNISRLGAVPDLGDAVAMKAVSFSPAGPDAVRDHRVRVSNSRGRGMFRHAPLPPFAVRRGCRGRVRIAVSPGTEGSMKPLVALVATLVLASTGSASAFAPLNRPGRSCRCLRRPCAPP